jgi:hypothetical protein
METAAIGGSWTVTGKRQVVLISMDDGQAFDAKNQAIKIHTSKEWELGADNNDIVTCYLLIGPA